MRLSEKAEELRQLRLTNLSSPEQVGFTPDKRGNMRKETIIHIKLFREDDTVSDAGRGILVYEDQNPNEPTTEAQLIRGQVWKKHEIGKLFLLLEGRRVELAKATPEEKVDVANGWFGEKGELILRSV